MKLIAFTGVMGSGKSTAVAAVGAYADGRSANVKFASTLYDIQEYIYNKIAPVYKKPENFIKDRKLLQWIGTEWGRNTISETLWIDLWKAQVESKSHYGLVTCDDVRFDNEAEAVKSMGGIIIKIVSNKTDNRIDTASGISNHASEAGVSDKYIDYVVENNGTISDLEEKLASIYNKHK